MKTPVQKGKINPHPLTSKMELFTTKVKNAKKANAKRRSGQMPVKKVPKK